MASQLSLFTATEQWQVQGRQTTNLSPTMSATALTDWKERVAEFQRSVRFIPAPQQPSLFESLGEDVTEICESLEIRESLPKLTGFNPTTIAPFELSRQNINFWRWPVEESGVAALYFVIDYDLPILLYVGETLRSHRRWKGVHDCKRYLTNYRQAHYEHQLSTSLGIGFWCHAPVQTRARQKLELTLIEQWRSPFNKENWEFWGTPFVGGKIKTS